MLANQIQVLNTDYAAAGIQFSQQSKLLCQNDRGGQGYTNWQANLGANSNIDQGFNYLVGLSQTLGHSNCITVRKLVFSGRILDPQTLRTLWSLRRLGPSLLLTSLLRSNFRSPFRSIWEIGMALVCSASPNSVSQRTLPSSTTLAPSLEAICRRTTSGGR